MTSKCFCDNLAGLCMFTHNLYLGTFLDEHMCNLAGKNPNININHRDGKTLLITNMYWVRNYVFLLCICSNIAFSYPAFCQICTLMIFEVDVHNLGNLPIDMMTIF